MTIKSKKSNGVNVVAAGFAYAGSQADAIKAVSTAVLTEKRDVKDVRADLIVGVMQRQLACTVAQARAAFEKSGADSKSKADARRTDVEEAAYGAGRVAWHRVAKPAGVVQEKRGGARNVKKSKRTGKAGKPAKQVKANPKVASVAEAHAHILNMAMMMSGFVSKNTDVFAQEGGQPLSSLVADFLRDVNKLK